MNIKLKSAEENPQKLQIKGVGITTETANGALTPFGKTIQQMQDLSKKIYELAELGKFIHYKNNINAWRTESTEEVSRAIDSLLFSKAYIGKLIGEMGVPTPYQNDGKRNSVNDIEPAANTSIPDTSSFRSYNTIQKVDLLRQLIQSILDVDMLVLANDMMEYTKGGVDLNNVELRRKLFLEQAYVNLIAAKMWLGFELGRIRESK